MVSLAALAEVRRLLDAVAAVEERLAPQERELYRGLVAKYAEPVAVEPTERLCLEVMLRNVAIREGLDFDPEADGGRVIDPVVRRRR